MFSDCDKIFFLIVYHQPKTESRQEATQFFIYAKYVLLFRCHWPVRCFRAECAEILRAACAKLHEMQFLCIAKRAAVNEVNSNKYVPGMFT